MGAYLSALKKGEVTEKREDFIAGIILSAKHEWVGSVRLLHDRRIIQVQAMQGPLEVTIPDLVQNTKTEERVIEELATKLEEAKVRMYCFKTPGNTLRDAILFMPRVDGVSWSDGQWSKDMQETIKPATLTVALFRGQYTFTLTSDEPLDLPDIARDIFDKIYPRNQEAAPPSPTTPVVKPPAAQTPPPAPLQQQQAKQVLSSTK